MCLSHDQDRFYLLEVNHKGSHSLTASRDLANNKILIQKVNWKIVIIALFAETVIPVII